MIRNCFLFFYCFLFYNNLHVVAQNVYDLPSIIEYFTLDATDVATIQSWDFGSDNPAIKWKETRLQWDETTSTYIKSGTIQITIDGVSYPFSVILSGTKIIVNRVELNLSRAPGVPVFDLQKMLNAAGITTVYIKCDNPMPESYGTLAYSMFIKGKKEAWVAYFWQCRKGECSANIDIYYEKEKVEKLPCY